MPLRTVKQTSKILLIEEFFKSDDADDLATLIKNEDVNNKDDFLSKVEKKLEVKNFEEFCKKFMPSVWEWYEASSDPKHPIEFGYSVEKPNKPNAHELKLSENEFYKMVMDLYSKRQASSDANIDFDYSVVEKLLSPKQVIENAKELRKDLQYNFKKMNELDDGAKQEKQACIKKINSIRKSIVEQYKDSLTGKLKLALGDAQTRLQALPTPKNTNGVIEEAPQLLPCKVIFNADGNLDVIPLAVEDNNTQLLTDEHEDTKLLEDYISQDFDKHGGENNDFIKSIVVSIYCSGNAIQVIDRKELEKKCDMYSHLYKDSQDKFMRAISTAIEKILDVKVFFEQASPDGKKDLIAPMIVTNCKADKLATSTVKDKFQSFLNEMSEEPDIYKIWFAILPAIGDSAFVKNEDIGDVSLDDDIMAESSSDTFNTTDGDCLVSVNTLNEMLSILKKAKITTFFNFRANENTGFSSMTEATVNLYRKKLESIEGNEYAVFAYPNFTILPKYQADKNSEIASGVRLEIPGIYVDASYVAAGMVVGYMNPDVLTAKKFEVEKNYPGVGFDFEESDNRFKFLTSMAREGKTIWASAVEKNISKDKFGFCFCGNAAKHNGKNVFNTYVYYARNMHKDNSGTFDSLYTRLTMDFVLQYMRVIFNSKNKFKIKDINNMLKNEIPTWQNKAQAQSNLANKILRSSDDIVFNKETNKLVVSFNGTPTEVQIEIEKGN